MNKLVIQRLYKASKQRYSNAHHQGVAYVDHLNIRLLCALGISAPIDIYII